MKCQNCGKNEANIRYTQIINGVKKEIALCSECAAKLGIDFMETPDFPINFKSFLGDFFNDYAENEFLPEMATEPVKCKNCGMTYDEFIKTGMFGCENCYDTFRNPINSLLKNLHGTSKHIGRGYKNNIKTSNINIKNSEKISDKQKEVSKEEIKIEELNRQLEKAIKEERYEDAAKIRDQIKEMKK